MRLKRKKGFTLVELLVVIALIALIALIAMPLGYITIQKGRAQTAKDNAVVYLKALENYMTLHKADPIKYPFEFEQEKYYTVEELENILGEDIKKPTSGSVQTGKDNNVENASINIDGYDIICESSTECEIGESPIIHIIVPDGWSNAKEIEVIVVKKGLGLADEPFSYDGGNTWTDEKIKTITENSEIEFHAKDKNGKEIDEIYICTKKVNGKGENCYKYKPGSGKTGSSGKIIISGIDNEAPTCELEITGTENVDGYYNSDITAKISKMEDPVKNNKVASGIKTSNINYTKITQDGTYEIVGTVIDNAGNKGTCKKTVTKDTEKPTLELTVEGQARSDGYESGAKVIVKCTDNTGKISYQTPDIILNGGGSKTVTATCKDNAGNEASTTKAYIIYEYSSSEVCGYNSCANSACGTATGTRSTGRQICGSTMTCQEPCEEYVPTEKPVKCSDGSDGCTTTVWVRHFAYCQTPCGDTSCHDVTETYTYNKTCETAACGNKECWHK